MWWRLAEKRLNKSHKTSHFTTAQRRHWSTDLYHSGCLFIDISVYIVKPIGYGLNISMVFQADWWKKPMQKCWNGTWEEDAVKKNTRQAETQAKMAVGCDQWYIKGALGDLTEINYFVQVHFNRPSNGQDMCTFVKISNVFYKIKVISKLHLQTNYFITYIWFFNLEGEKFELINQKTWRNCFSPHPCPPLHPSPQL